MTVTVRARPLRSLRKKLPSIWTYLRQIWTQLKLRRSKKTKTDKKNKENFLRRLLRGSEKWTKEIGSKRSRLGGPVRPRVWSSKQAGKTS